MLLFIFLQCKSGLSVFKLVAHYLWGCLMPFVHHISLRVCVCCVSVWANQVLSQLIMSQTTPQEKQELVERAAQRTCDRVGKKKKRGNLTAAPLPSPTSILHPLVSQLNGIRLPPRSCSWAVSAVRWMCVPGSVDVPLKMQNSCKSHWKTTTTTAC